MKFNEPEGQSLEYKREWCDTAKKTMIAFANDLGGILQIGVADDGEVVGCNFDQVDRSVHSFARDGVQPSMSDLVQVRRVDVDGKAVASVLIAPGSQRPYGFRGKVLTDGGAYIRLGGQTVAATFEEVMRLVQRGDPRFWEGRVCNEQNLTFDESKEVFESSNIPFGEANWLGYGLQSRSREFTNLALLLSDQNPYAVIINKYDASGKVTGSDRLKGSVLRQWEIIRDRLSELNQPVIDKESADFSRQETYPWPQIALREALTNTIAHRDYSSPLHVAINIHPDVITFLTPGGIPPELTLDDAMVEGASFCRNEKLAELFMRLHWMEKAGTGFGDIIRAYAKFAQSPVFKHIARTFLIELPCVIKQQVDKESEIIRFIKQSPNGRRRSEIEEELGVSRPTLMKLLKQLQTEGKISVKGKARSTRYYVPQG